MTIFEKNMQVGQLGFFPRNNTDDEWNGKVLEVDDIDLSHLTPKDAKDISYQDGGMDVTFTDPNMPFNKGYPHVYIYGGGKLIMVLTYPEQSFKNYRIIPDNEKTNYALTGYNIILPEWLKSKARLFFKRLAEK